MCNLFLLVSWNMFAVDIVTIMEQLSGKMKMYLYFLILEPCVHGTVHVLIPMLCLVYVHTVLTCCSCLVT